MTINDELYDRIVQHLADTRLYELETQTNIGRGLRRHRKRLRDLLVQNIRSNLKPEVTRMAKELNQTTENALSDYAGASASFHANNLNKGVGSFFKVTKPKPSDIFTDIIGPNIETSRSLKEHFNSIGEGELIRIQGKINQGLADGKSNKEIIQSVLETTSITESQAKALVRTGITRTQSVVVDRLMRDNSEVIAGYRFTAVLDSRTSRICSSHDGEFYPVNDKRYVPPLHWNCRSSLVPVLKSKSEIQKVESEKITTKTLDKLDPKVLDGQPPKREDYSSWLIRQPMNVKVKHLGSEEKVSLFEKGALAVKEFITPKGGSISVSVLRKLDNARTAIIPVRQAAREKKDIALPVSRPYDLMRSPAIQEELRQMYIADAESMNQAMSLVDFRGTSIIGKKTSRIRANNEFDERNQSFDPFTGEVRSTLLYEPDFSVYQERLDFLRSSKALSRDQKEFIETFAESLEDKISVNQQSVVVENLRVLFERYENQTPKVPWENFANVARAESQYSVVNVSRILDRRSRERSEAFAAYGQSGEPAKVNIFGKYFSFDDISSNQLDNQRYIDNWAEVHGRPIARSLYYRGRAPLKSYFVKPDRSKPQTIKDKIIKYLEDNVPGFKALTKKEKPKDGIITEFLRGKREDLRKIIDLEFLYGRERQSFLDRMVEGATGDKAAIDVLAKVLNTVADGQSTDYDSLAINIGKVLRENWKPLFPFFKPTLKDYHEDGSRILQGLRDQGLIRVLPRGKTRRSVVDLETGRASGPWKDTVSREVTILDKNMRELQSRNRQLLVARNIGIVRSRDRLYVRTGQKTYYDARGKDTRESIITRRASGNYDQDLVDQDFSKMLNHTMSVEYEVDNEFAGFMDELVRFRDPRGNVKKYDDLNDFRRLILTRGEQGFAFMQTVKWHKDRGQPFTVIAQIDGRGRVYYQGYLTPTGGEVVRPFLNSARSVNLNQTSLKELMTQTGALLGPATEALTVDGRMEIFLRNEKALREIGDLVLSTTQRDRRLREFLEHPLVRATDAEEIPKLTRLAVEYTRIHRWTGGNLQDTKRLEKYKTKLMIENDASSSGAQIIGLSTGDRSISINSNVVPTNQKNRLYDLVAMDTVSDPEFQKIEALANANIQWTDLQKAAKAQNMVSFYGAGKATQAANIEAKFASVLEEKGYTVITREELRGITNVIDKKIKDAEFLGAENVSIGLKQLKRELNEVIEGEAPVGNELLQAARDVHPDVEVFANKLSNVRTGLIGPNEFKKVSEIMSKHLAERAPVTGKFVKFWNEAAKTYVEETQKVDLPWVTFDGKKLYQRYRPKVQTSIEFRDPQTNRMVRNIYEAKAEDATLLGKASISRARIGMGVNGNHMNDASIVRQFHLWGAKSGTPTATIHDAFFTNIGEAQKAKDALRVIYADALEGETIKNTLKEMRNQGLSAASYNRLVALAKEEGLIDPPNKLTRQDILAPIPKGMDWYGIGP